MTPLYDSVPPYLVELILWMALLNGLVKGLDLVLQFIIWILGARS